MEYFRVKNWEQFQHYKDRNPPWIKLHKEILGDYEYCQLPDASKSHLFAIWLLASRYNNSVPYDAGWIATQISASDEVNLQVLLDHGFIAMIAPQAVDSREHSQMEQDASKSLAKRSPETETETETDIKKTAAKKATSSSHKISDSDFERIWESRPRRKGTDSKQKARNAINARLKQGQKLADIEAGMKRYKSYCQTEGMLDTQYVMALATFCGPDLHFNESWTFEGAKAEMASVFEGDT